MSVGGLSSVGRSVMVDGKNMRGAAYEVLLVEGKACILLHFVFTVL